MTFFGPDIRNGLPIGLGSVAGFGRRAFTPSVLFAAGEQGFWYDPSDRTTLFQDSAGTTPVTGVEQAVGLILDKIRGLVLGPELVTNGDFSNGSTGWSAGPVAPSGWTFAGGVCSGSNAAGGYQSVGQVVSGRSYIAEFTISNYSSGAVSLSNSDTGGFGEIFSSAGVKRQIFTATATGTVGFVRRISNFNGDIDNFSVRELAGNHAIQPTSASRPTLRARYNQLLYSEDFSNAAWTKVSASVTPNDAIAPDGTLTADRITATTGSVGARLQQDQTVTAAGAHTYYLRLKRGNVDIVATRIYNNTTSTNLAEVLFNLSTGVVSTTTAGSGTITNLGDGWFLCAVTAASGISAGNSLRSYVYPGGTSPLLNEYVFAWGADLRSSNDTYLPYQRIAAATDYDTVGFPPYLAFDGSDDSLYTGGNVDFSATDKMTVWAGVTKLSDAATGMGVELSADIGSNNGAFNMEIGPTAARYRVNSKGTSLGQATTNTVYAAPITSVLTGICDIGGDIARLNVDGTQAATDATDQGTGNFGSYPLYVGRRNNASLPFNGRLYQLIGRGAATSAALITQAERWVASKQGRTL